MECLIPRYQSYYYTNKKKIRILIGYITEGHRICVLYDIIIVVGKFQKFPRSGVDFLKFPIEWILFQNTP